MRFDEFEPGTRTHGAQKQELHRLHFRTFRRLFAAGPRRSVDPNLHFAAGRQ